MELLEYEDLMRRLRAKRNEVGLQQKEVAHRAGIDASHLSRMEQHSAQANYETVYDVWKVIEREASSNEETAGELMAAPIEWAKTEESHRDVAFRMREGKFSQLPVRDESGDHVGRITESILMDNDDTERPVRDLMEAPLMEVPQHMGREAVRGILTDDEPAVIVTDDSEPVGIVTKTDLM